MDTDSDSDLDLESDYGRIWSAGNLPSSYSGSGLFLRHNPHVNATKLREEILPFKITYQKFRTAKRPRVYNPYFVRTKRKIFQSDLIFMRNPPQMVKDNGGYQYILIVMDIFSRKIWTAPLKNKKGAAVRPALQKIFRKIGNLHKNARIIIDRGTEYLNNPVKQLLHNFGLSITHPSDGHAAHVERANLSLQRLIYQHMTEVGGKRKWLAYLPTATEIMNTRYHRIIKMTPEQAEMNNNRASVNDAMSLYRHKAFMKQSKRIKNRVKK